MPPRVSPRASHSFAARGVKPSVCSRKPRLASLSGSRAKARTPSNPCSASSLGTSGCEATSGSSGGSAPTSSCVGPSGSGKDNGLGGEAPGIGESQGGRITEALDVLAAQPLGPERQRVVRRDPPTDQVHHPGAGAPRNRARVFKEGDVGPRITGLVRVEQVVDGRVVLVDRLLDEPQAEHPRVEVDVARSVAGDARDVVDAVELHATPASRNARCSLTISRAITSRWIWLVPS